MPSRRTGTVLVPVSHHPHLSLLTHTQSLDPFMLSNHLPNHRAGTCSRHINQNGRCAAPALRLQNADCPLTRNPRDFEPALLHVFRLVEFPGTIIGGEK